MQDIIYNSVFNAKNKEANDDTKALEQDKLQRFMADGQINTIKEVMTIIKRILRLCNQDKDIGLVDSHTKVISEVPTITYSIIKRSKSSKTPIKSKLIGEIKEVVDGKLTGDVFQIHETIYDCLVEFNFFGNNTNEIIDIKDNFESMIETYTGDLKLAGVSEMYFMEEVTPSVSTQAEYNPKATSVFYIELQNLKTIRLSSIKNVSTEIKTIVEEESRIANILDNLTKNNTFI